MTEIRESMNHYFEHRLQYFNEGVRFLFTTEYDNNVHSMLYHGEINDDGEIGWQPVVKNIIHYLDALKGELNCRFHRSIYDYFNSYWFADLDGFIDGHYVSLEPVLPGVELIRFAKNLQGYKDNHHNTLKYAPIGIEGNGLLVVINNDSGQVGLEDFERKEFTVLSDRLGELIASLRVKKSL